jgi:hypothetical protein
MLGKLCHHVDERLIGFAVFFAETRDDGTELGDVELGGCVDPPGKEAFAERAERNEADAELFQCGHDAFLGLPPEEGVRALQCGNGPHGVSAATCSCTCFGEAEVLYLACLNLGLDCAGGLFDGSVGVDAMLAEEVDGVGLRQL